MNQKLHIKVCGLTNDVNRKEIEKLPVDFLGFIFYPSSKRYVGKSPDQGLFNASKNKVAVFVNESIYEIMGLTKNLGFRYVQLHGSEKPETCKILKDQGLKVIKAFNLNENFDFSELRNYENVADYFLFDTKSNVPGGSGKKFNWEILKRYSGNLPFFLSGGIKPEDAGRIRQFSHPRLFGIDLNSGFETEPGLKKPEVLEDFIGQLATIEGKKI